MKTIRHGVFETNSSSSHSISISRLTDGIYDTIPPDKNGIIKLSGGQYGWEWETYSLSIDKANYAATFAKDSKEQLNILAEVIKDHTGARKVKYDFGTDDYCAYIDHQSAATETSAEFFNSKKSLKDFLFNPKSYVRTGNDNSEDPLSDWEK